jgi:hypothetical protein
MTGFDIQHAMFQVYGVASTKDMYDIDTLSLRAFAARISRLLTGLRFHRRETS